MARDQKSRNGKTDVTQLLKFEHEEVEALFHEFEDLDEPGERQQLASHICDMLEIHAQLEEELVYPVAREMLDDEDLVLEAEVEHRVAKDLVTRIRSMAADDPTYGAYVKVLGEYVTHHVDEEERELLPRLKSSDADTAALGQELLQRKRELQRQRGIESVADEDLVEQARGAAAATDVTEAQRRGPSSHR
ncbi:MAG: hemerythrin domain-containing protein [Lysobacterales bacterium]|jgi:hemerythrin superfamily protein|nr:MAG: hemerythrin domain-containing protein [Xanthomonadales bacterium]